MNRTNTMAIGTWFVASLMLLAGCAETSYTAGGMTARDGAGATDPEVVVYAHKSWIGDPRDPKWVTIHEVRHSIHWQTWALNPPESHKKKLMTAAKIVEFPQDDANMKEFVKKRKDDQRPARESFRKLFDIWRNGDYATAYIGFREGIVKNNQDSHTAWFYFAESASKIGRHIDAVNGYRNTIALAPDSEEGITAKGRIQTLLKSTVGGLPEPVFNDVTDYSVCISTFVKFDMMKNAGRSFPSARPRYRTMVRDLGASQAQLDAAMDKYDAFSRRRLEDMAGNVSLLQSQLESYKGFIPMLGGFGIDGGFDRMKRQCPLALLIESREFQGARNYELYKRPRSSLTEAERAELEEPEISFASTTYVSKENRVPFP